MMLRSFIRPAAVATLVASMSWLGCGVKSPPIPPEYAKPEKITDLAAASQRGGIMLGWQRPDTYASGTKMRDLGKFYVVRSEKGGGFQNVAEISVTDQERFQQQSRFAWIDKNTKIGHTYRYEVISQTLDGYRSVPSNQAEATRKVPKPAPNPENYVLPRPTPLP